MDGVASSLDCIRWDHLEDRASKEEALLASVTTLVEFPARLVPSKAVVAWARQFCLCADEPTIMTGDPSGSITKSSYYCPFCCNYYHTAGEFGRQEEAIIRHLYHAHDQCIPRVLVGLL